MPDPVSRSRGGQDAGGGQRLDVRAGERATGRHQPGDSPASDPDLTDETVRASGDRVLRPAMVGVAKGGAKAAREASEAK